MSNNCDCEQCEQLRAENERLRGELEKQNENNKWYMDEYDKMITYASDLRHRLNIEYQLNPRRSRAQGVTNEKAQRETADDASTGSQ